MTIPPNTSIPWRGEEGPRMAIHRIMEAVAAASNNPEATVLLNSNDCSAILHYAVHLRDRAEEMQEKAWKYDELCK